MTCIVALKHEGKVYMGGDSAASSYHFCTTRIDSKVFIKDQFIIGFTSSFRMGQLLEYNLHSVEPAKNSFKNQMKNDIEFMSTIFIDNVRKCLKEGGYANHNNNVETGGEFLVGYKGNIYHICSDFQVGVPVDNYDSVGCGDQIALGAISAYHQLSKKIEPKKAIEIALTAASKYSGFVKPPFKILCK